MRGSTCWLFSYLVLLLFSSGGCGDGICTKQAQEFCTEGVVYWADSCGNLGDAKEYCHCGCNNNQSACKSCTCSCSNDDACCDGCLPIREGHVCDDGDEDTVTDICTDGACTGWNPDDIPEPTPPAEPALPAEPEPPHLRSWTCPDNWTAVEHEDLLDENGDPFSWCEPSPLPRLKAGTYVTPLKDGEQEGDRPVCEPELDGTFPLLGYDTCQPLGDPCPAGTFPEIPPEVTGNRIYVLAGASGGSGTEGDPFGTINAAVGAAVSGDVIVIGAGVYPESLTLSKNLTLWGKCVQETVIDAPEPGASIDDGAIMSSGIVDATLRNLRIGGDRNALFLNASGCNFTAQGVWIHGSTMHGILALRGTLSASDVLIDSVRPDSDGHFGYGLFNATTAQTSLVNVTLENNYVLGLATLDAAANLTATNLVVRNTQPQQDGQIQGFGLVVTEEGHAEVSGALFDGNRLSGILVNTDESSLELTDFVCQDTHGQVSDRTGGIGLLLQSRVQFTGSRGLFRRNRAEALYVGTPGGSTELTDLIVRDTLEEDHDRMYGFGLYIVDGALVSVRRALIERNLDAGLLIHDAGSSLLLEDAVVQDTAVSSNTEAGGMGIQVHTDAAATLRRVHLRRNRTTGASATAGGRLTLEDVRVADTASDPNGEFGYGVAAALGARLELTRAVVERNQVIGIQSGERGTEVILTDVSVRDTLCLPSGELDAYGMLVTQEGTVTLTRGLFDGNCFAGIRVELPGSEATLEDLTIRNTVPRSSDSTYGDGIVATDGGAFSINRGRIEANNELGILLNNQGTTGALTDITVKDTRTEDPSGHFGWGMQVGYGAQVALERAVFEGNREIGVLVTRSSHASATDLVIRDTSSSDTSESYGRGLEINTGSQALVARGLFENNRDSGVFVGSGQSRLECSDIIIRQTHSRSVDGRFGCGLDAILDAELIMSRGRIEDNHYLGLGLYKSGTRATLDQVLIRDTTDEECALEPDPTCDSFAHGTDLGVYEQAELTFHQVSLDSSSLVGLQVADQATVHGSGLTIRNNPIAVNLQDLPEAYKFFESVKGLWLEDNPVNFDATELPIPDPVGILDPAGSDD